MHFCFFIFAFSFCKDDFSKFSTSLSLSLSLSYFSFYSGISYYDASEESDIIARVLAQSQQEYLDSLKRNVNKNVTQDTESAEKSSKLDYPSSAKHSPGSSKVN